MLIALFHNERKKNSFDLAIQIRTFLEAKGVTVVAEDASAENIGVKSISEVNPNEIKFLISIGGDGTILRLFNKYGHLDAAIVGINLGHLGFMADIPTEDIYPSLNDLLNGSYTLDQRLVLEAKKNGEGDRLLAVNDVVIHRAHNYSLIELSIILDGTYVNTFVADGVIIATPNGSTAYSLASGGPILSPDLEAVVITPICAHTISNRPIVISADHKLQIQYLSDYAPIDVRADGHDAFSLESGKTIEIYRSNRTFKLVNLARQEYFSTLRTKLGWSGGKVR